MVLVLALASVPVPASAARLVQVVSALRAVLHLQAKRHARSVLLDRRVAVAASSIPRPKKAR